MADNDEEIKMPFKDRPNYKTFTEEGEGSGMVVKGKKEVAKDTSPKSLKEYNTNLKKIIKD